MKRSGRRDRTLLAALLTPLSATAQAPPVLWGSNWGEFSWNAESPAVPVTLVSEGWLVALALLLLLLALRALQRSQR